MAKDFSLMMMEDVNTYSGNSGIVLSKAERNYALNIITSTAKKLKEDGIAPSDVDWQGCKFPAQVKRFCRLGLDLNEKEIYLDIRNNGKTGKKDINLKMQYQGETKLLTKFCQKGGGVEFITGDVVMKGENLKMERDLRTGKGFISGHDIPDMFHRNITYANKENVIGAYAIAYHKDGSQTYVVIDKVRIDRAEQASASREKTIYKNDYKKMVIKTAVHELYNQLRTYMEIPDDLETDLAETMVDFEGARQDVNQNANSEYIDVEAVEKENAKQIGKASVRKVDSSPVDRGEKLKVNQDTGEVYAEEAFDNEGF